MSTKKLYTLVSVFAVFGIMLAIYLLYEQITKSTSSICNISESVNCDAIISGPVSKTLGIPTPLIGLVGYICILFASIYKIPKLALGMSTFGLLFCLWIGYRELFELNVICPMCIGCQTIIIVEFILSIILNRKEKVELIA